MRRFALAVVLLACAPAFASNLSGDAPMANFKGKDQALFDAALKGVLDDDKDGVSRTWTNPETKAGGEVKSVKSFTRADAKCRTVSVANKAQGRTSNDTFNFCRSADGTWKISN